ncbi:MAG: AraC family transcriptional regulator [Chloroflexota bacterium]
MSNADVRIVKLEPMRVAAALGFGASPEPQAWEKLQAWMQRQGITDLKAHRFFGFNNPNPSPGSPNYGYEQWITVGLDAQGDEEVTVKDVPGGLYAVMRCQGVPNPQVWGELVMWRDGSAYRAANHQWLEECLTPEMPASENRWLFDLYLPVADEK